MAAATDSEALATTIEAGIVNTLDAESCVCLVFDTETDQVVFESPGRTEYDRKSLEERDGLYDWLIKRPEPTVIPDVCSVEWFSLIRPEDLTTPRAAMIVPGQVDAALYGLLVVFGRSTGELFLDEDLDIARALMRHASIAVKHILHAEYARREMVGSNALYEVGKRISSSLDIDEVLTLIIDSLQMVVPYDAAMILLLNKTDNTADLQTVRGYTESVRELMHLKIGEGIIGWAAKTGQVVIVPDVRQDPRYVNLRPETRSEMAVPLLQGDEVIGVFNIESDLLSVYDERDRALLEAFASQATIAIQNARLHQESMRTRQLEHELGVAGEIQRALLPRKIPNVPGLSLTVYSEPSAEVGGDFYDILTFSNRYVGLAVGDVAGKGIPGAIMMASLYTAFHEYATDSLMTASDVMARVNVLLHNETALDRFATLFYGVLSLSTGNIRYCNAGHTPPILCRLDGTVKYLSTGGLVLGPFPYAEYHLGEEDLMEGDILVLYTDGMTEARNAEGEEFGLDGLMRVVQACPGLSAEEVRTCLIGALQTHIGDSPQHDDITIIMLKVNEDFHSELTVV